jgi:hypothetical protein
MEQKVRLSGRVAARITSRGPERVPQLQRVALRGHQFVSLAKHVCCQALEPVQLMGHYGRRVERISTQLPARQCKDASAE